MALERRQQEIRGILESSGGIQFLRKLTAGLHYAFAGERLPTGDWKESAREPLAEDPQLFATAAGGEFHVIYTPLKGERPSRAAQRRVVNSLLDKHPYALFVFSNRQQDRWHFVNVRHDERQATRRLFRRIAVGAGERLHMAMRSLAMLDLETIKENRSGLSPLEVQARHDEAFDVELVTKRFFNEYKSLHAILRDDLTRQTKERRRAHDDALQFLNRCLFLYFIQRKGWLGGDTEFLNTFWRSYQRSGRPKDTFFEQWLKVLFFETFNNRKSLLHSAQRAYIPEGLRDALRRAPYLNDGLFGENDLDRAACPFQITDSRFKQVFDFLERYNFTLAEDSPLDREVAVDPEMIGKVCESLVNVSAAADERGGAGIFYTQRTEIDLMCRLALVNHLTNVIGEEHRRLLRGMVFALEPHEQETADAAVREQGLWNRIEACLREVTTVDPACGSGSFLVGMLHVLDDLQRRAAGGTGNRETAYERKRRIIGQSLYGVDVMRWAAPIVELRMWCALIADAGFTQEELSARTEPLLPHFSFRIRSGDSLVQEAGGLSLSNLRGLRTELSPALKARVANLKKEKLRFYNNEAGRKFESARELEREELNLFRDVLDDRRAGLEEDGEQMRAASRALKSVEDVPFVWDIAFVEIFSGERGGFSIVVGNPPYVRQETIADPRTARECVSAGDRRAYKAKLQRAVYRAFPRFFGYDEKRDKARRALDSRSDLYIYFYFLTLPLLDARGAFCFITSNSWLDVGYGAGLQEFLLRRCHVQMVIDNAARRSFESADVNTVITLLSPPISDKADDAEGRVLEQTARFVMFRTPFENVLSSVLFTEIEEATGRRQAQEYRVFPVRQKELLEDGMKLPDEEDEAAPFKSPRRRARASSVEAGHYAGNKWGGKYLRAPDIYWTVMDKGKGLITQLAAHFNGERYLNTGGADGFFIPTEVEKLAGGNYYVINANVTSASNTPFAGEIESTFLEPLVKDYTKSHKAIEISGFDAYCLVVREKPTPKLERYIAWGEKQEYHLRSATKSQNPWFKPTNQMLSSAKVLVPRSFNNSFVIHSNPHDYLSLRFYRLHLKKGEPEPLVAYLNSTLMAFFLETLGNKTLGQGVLDFFMADFLSLRIPVVESSELKAVYQKMKRRNVLSVVEEYGVSRGEDGQLKASPLPDRQELDAIVFDALHLTGGEREAVYEAVIELAGARLAKASSLKPKDGMSERTHRHA